MNTGKVRYISIILVFLFMAGGCATQQTVRQPPAFQVQPLVKEMWRQKVDNLIIVLDASASMSESYNGFEKFDIGRRMVSRFNKTMPDLAFKVALRSFGHSLAYSYKSTVPVYGLSDYSRDGIAAALADNRPGRRSQSDGKIA